MAREIDLNNIDHCQSNLYSFKNLKAKKILDGISISNGLAWSPDEKTVYYIDSPKHKVFAYQYDKETTEFTNPKTVIDFKENNLEGFPDGMTIDADGNLWIACFGGGQVLNVDPRTEKIIQKVELPAKFITSVAFGGPNYEDLYVTSSTGLGMNESYQLKPEDGCTLLVTGIGVKGLPAIEMKL